MKKLGESNIKEIRRALDQTRSYKEILVRNSLTRQKYTMMIIVIENNTTMSRILVEDSVARSGSLLQDKPEFS
jgi:hypothetical protein